MGNAYALRIFVISLLCASIGGGMYALLLFLLRPNYYTIIADYRLNKDFQQTIQSYIHNNDFSDIFSGSLKTAFPVITDVKTKIHPIQHGIIHYQVAQPRAKIITPDKPLLLTEKSTLVDCNLYDSSVTSNLLTLYVQEHAECISLPDLEQFINHIPEKIWNEFTIDWKNKTDITLIPLCPSLYRIKVTAQTIFDDSFFNGIDYLINKRVSKTKQRWIIDSRFNNQMVLKKEGKA